MYHDIVYGVQNRVGDGSGRSKSGVRLGWVGSGLDISLLIRSGRVQLSGSVWVTLNDTLNLVNQV